MLGYLFFIIDSSMLGASREECHSDGGGWGRVLPHPQPWDDMLAKRLHQTRTIAAGHLGQRSKINRVVYSMPSRTLNFVSHRCVDKHFANALA